MCFTRKTCKIIKSAFFFNNWGIVDLQCCVSFRCTAKWLSYTYTYIHPFPVSFPIQLITEYWVEFPGLYSSSLLGIYFIDRYVYVNSNLPICPSTLTPGNHKSVFYICNYLYFECSHWGQLFCSIAWYRSTLHEQEIHICCFNLLRFFLEGGGLFVIAA